jgi:hypothetical protein
VIARLLAACLIALSTPAWADAITITSTPVRSFQNLSTNTTFGPFTWRGGLSLKSAAPKFGGFSGLALSNNCQDLLAISDAGRWFKASLAYEGGSLKGISNGELAPMLDSKGKPQRNKVWGDAEAMAMIAPGKVAVAYESRVRFGIYDIGKNGFDARFQHIAYPEDIDRGPDNGEVEALGRLPSGAFIAISERNRDAAGNLRGWTWRGTSSTAFSIERHDDYDITDLVVMPDANILTLERSFSRRTLPGMAIRLFPASGIGKNKTIKPRLLFEGRIPFYAIDNMEGIAVCERDGESRVTILSDNNFNIDLQSTLLLQFAYEP